MITKIRVGNFYSIGEEIELSFVKGGEKQEESYFSYKKNEKVSLINGFYGANASGKSNIMRAMITVIRMMYSAQPSLAFSSESQWLFPNFHADFKDESTKLGIDFLFGDNYYSYDLEIKDGKNIVSETLLLTTLALKSARPKKIFSRIGSAIDFGPEYKEYENYLDLTNIPPYQTFAFHLINNVRATKAVNDFIVNQQSFFLKGDDLDLQMPTLAAVLNKAMRLDSLPQSDKERSLAEITKLANCFDESIKSISINTSNNNVAVEFEHENFNKKVNIMQESAGTRELFSYMEDLLNALRNGGVVVYDETNRYYHPDVELALLSLFKNNEFNSKNAQLFFTSHNHETFDLLEQDQSHIIEKIDTSTTVFKLSEVEDLQKRDNLKKKYRLGMFGGVPDIIGLEYSLKQLL